jgi:RNA polymerase sigma-70 factor (ECF subfamily)
MLQPVGQLPLDSSDDNLPAVVELARAGEMDAFNALFSRYSARICTYLARMVGNDEEGRDLAQETFLKAWSTLPEIREPTRFSSWLYRIATNIAIDYLRAQKLRRWLPWPQSGKESEQKRSLQMLDPTARIAETDHIRQALVRITPRYRACLLLQIEGGFSQREIATLLHLSEKSISIYVQRGCEQFRQAYQHLAPESSLASQRSVQQ